MPQSSPSRKRPEKLPASQAEPWLGAAMTLCAMWQQGGGVLEEGATLRIVQPWETNVLVEGLEWPG